ncbi:MAG: hypothetical protein HN413_16960 [Chloroflexi bacterium]|jgi:hypothetical protein|nr:hypothetical protein [Chloroflexota bacterium]
MDSQKRTLREITTKTIIIHTITYFAVGLVAYSLFDYTTQFADPALKSLMRPTDDPLVQAGVLLQPIRGLLFGLIFYRLQKAFFQSEKGYLNIWLILVVVGIFSTFGTAPGSIEGLIYTKAKFAGMWMGLSEVLLQSFLLAYLTWYWVKHPEKKWLGRVFVTIFVVALLLPALGLLAALTMI